MPSERRTSWLNVPARAVLLAALSVLIVAGFLSGDGGVHRAALVVLVVMWTVNAVGLVRRLRR